MGEKPKKNILRNKGHTKGETALKITAVDLVETICEFCGEEIYPSVLSSVEDKWKNKYACDKCLCKKKIIGKRDIKKVSENIIQNKVINSFPDYSWIDEPDIKEMFDTFKIIEETDRNYIKSNPDLCKVHEYLNGIDHGILRYEKEEIIDYFNFYGNSLDVVSTLKILMENDPTNRFIRETYIDSRTRKLSKEQLNALKGNRAFSFLPGYNKEFWNKLVSLQEYLHTLLVNTPNEELLKECSIVDNVLTLGHPTKNQKDAITGYFKKYKI